MKVVTVFILLGLVFCIYGQVTVQELVDNPDKYIFGVGSGCTMEEADRNALHNLNVSISATIKTTFADDVIEINRIRNGEEECTIEEYSHRIVEISANNFLKDTQKIVSVYEPDNDFFEIYRYITIASKDAVFEGRRNKAVEYKKQAEEYLKLVNVHQGLLDYYSALLLINSHPDRDHIRVKQDNIEKNFKMLMETRLRNTLSAIKFTSVSEKEMGNFYRVNIKATYMGKEISSLYFRYFDGKNTIKGNIIDGFGSIDIQKSQYEQDDSFPIYIYYGKGELDRVQLIEPELKELEEFLFTQNFENKKMIRKPGEEMQELEVEVEEIKESKESIKEDPISDEERDAVAMVMQQVVDAIRNGICEGVEDCFTDSGFEQFSRLMDYGEMSVYENNQKIRLVKTGDRIQVRTIPVILKLREPSETKIYSEKLCFILEDNKISWINFAMEDHYIEDIISKNIDTKDFEKRLAGLNFMEYYKTIFNLKQADLISEIFADSAHIFVGYVKDTEEIDDELSNDLKKSLGSKSVIMEKMSKDKYIEHLRDGVFPTNRYIHIAFKDMLLLRRSETKHIYAISLHQDYYSTTYSDQGYLMLLINFENPEEPRIFFRYWQPEKFGEKELRGITPGDIWL